MHVIQKSAHCHNENVFDIDADKNLYQTIVEDMIENAENFLPRSVWQKLYNSADYDTYKDGAERYKELVLTNEEILQSANNVVEQYVNLSSLLDAWVGPRGKRDKFDEGLIKAYQEYLSLFDSGSFFDCFLKSDSYKVQSDLLTVEEITVINKLTVDKEKLSVLEIGGGYGRLAEAMLNIYGKQVGYVMADSVPISLMFCYLFLKKNLPQMKIGIYYLDSYENLEQYNCYIVPSWHLEKVCNDNNKKFDLNINIQSMQEMSQWHVDYFLNFFDRFSCDGTITYLHNNKNYIFQGQWNYPENWELLFRHNSPWAWSEDCPIEVFRHSPYSHKDNNLLTSTGYKMTVKIIGQKKKTISDLSRILMEKNEKIIKMESTLLGETEMLEEKEKMLIDTSRKLNEVELVLMKKEKEVEQQKLELQAKELEVEQQKLELQAKELEVEQQKLELQAKELESEQQKLELQANELESEQQKLELYKMYKSSSWKITAPIRYIGDIVKRINNIK